ncbi:STAS domain-containing protein [bacterium]|nr:STAS domain-containing protein [bacterium]
MTEIIRDGDHAQMKLDDDLMTSTVETVKKKIKHALNAGAAQLSLDLGNVNSLDSMGLGLLVATHNSLQKNGHRLQLSNVSDDIAGLLRKLRLDTHFEIA